MTGYEFTPDAERAALRLVAALADVADDDDPTLLRSVVEDLLDVPGGPPMGAVLLALARRHLALMRRRHGDESASVILRAQVAATHLGDVGGL